LADRDGFLKKVAERLECIPERERGDGIVFQICRDVQHEFWDPPMSRGAAARAFER
jgi:hypothetical protein